MNRLEKKDISSGWRLKIYHEAHFHPLRFTNNFFFRKKCSVHSILLDGIKRVWIVYNATSTKIKTNIIYVNRINRNLIILWVVELFLRSKFIIIFLSNMSQASHNFQQRCSTMCPTFDENVLSVTFFSVYSIVSIWLNFLQLTNSFSQNDAM